MFAMHNTLLHIVDLPQLWRILWATIGNSGIEDETKALGISSVNLSSLAFVSIPL